MQTVLLTPSGYCAGVKRAMAMAIKAKEDHPEASVYLLGNLVHNEIAVKELSDHGLIVIDERKTPLLDALLDLSKGDVVVFSAHGHPDSYDDLAELKGLTIIDATCPFVLDNAKEGKESTRPVVYLGVPGHLESEAFLANCPDAVFYDVKAKSFNMLKVKGKKEPPLLIAQTTLSKEEVEDATKDILSYFPDAKLGKERCFSTKERQEAVLALDPKDIDALIVLGSATSNNSLKLQELGKKNGIPSYLCLDKEAVSRLDLSSCHKVALISGASTSEATLLEAKAYLESL